MISAILKYLLYFSLAFVVIYVFQNFLFKDPEAIRYNLLNVDIFFASISFVICALLRWLSKVDELKTQLGFLYLSTLFIKAFLFFAFFRTSISELEHFTLLERINLMIPLFIFLILEVVLIARILSKKPS